MTTKNPLIGDSNTETVQNVAQALDAFMLMLSSQNSNQHLLLLPLQDALEHVAFPEGDR